jgi:acetyl-CoA carboxylase biotin carboxyl carrier protein
MVCYTPRIDLMNLKELKEIIDIVTERESIEELELEKSGVRLRIRKASTQGSSVYVTPAAATASAPPVSRPPQVPPEALQETEEELYYIKSPIVGTFYKAPSPTSEAFAVGDFVEKGTVVCIIEAMKLMNEIESDVAGEIVSILVENGQPVEYDERLFAIRPR